MKEKIDAYFEGLTPLLVEHLCPLLAVPSLKAEGLPGKPYGEEIAKALEIALDSARSFGLSAENLEGYVGVCDLNELPTNLHILGHLDVVPPGEGWTVTEPFTPYIDGDMIYARGTADDKGPTLAALLAMRAVKDMGLATKANVRLILGTDEESGFSDIEWYYARNPHAEYTLSPDAQFPLVNVEKGHFHPIMTRAFTKPQTAEPCVIDIEASSRHNVVPGRAHAVLRGFTSADLAPYMDKAAAETGVKFTVQEGESFSLHAEGTPTHASTPSKGNNALTALLSLLATLPLAEGEAKDTLQSLATLFPHGKNDGEGLGITLEDEAAGKLSAIFSVIRWSPERFEGQFDARTPICATKENCVDVTEAALSAHGIAMEGELDPAHNVPGDSDYVKMLLDTYTRYTGKPGYCRASGGGTYVHGIPNGVAFGGTPEGFESGLHGADEHIELSALITTAKIYTHVIATICGEGI